MKILMAFSIVLFGAVVFGHGSHLAAGHEAGHDAGHESAALKASPNVELGMQKISEAYQAKIKSIFEKSCADCHSLNVRMPKYASWPIAKQLIEHDINDGRDHLDITGGFPFKSHASPLEDLKSIKEEVEEGEMPPWRYWLFHSGAKLSAAEKKTVSDWADESMKLLTTP